MTMKDSKRSNAIQVLEREIQKHSKVLNRLLMEEKDVELRNGVYFPKEALNHVDLNTIRTDRRKFEKIIADLMLVRQALKKKRNSVILCGPCLPIELCNSFEAAGLTFDGDEFTGEIFFD